MTTAAPFLQAATPNQLRRAAASNHRQWMVLGARATGGAVHREDGVTWVETGGPSPEVSIPFPRLERGRGGGQLDAVLASTRAIPDLRQVGCWSLHPQRPRDLGARLLARGFEWGWQPHWMALDLETMNEDFPIPDGLRVEPLEGEGIWGEGDHPHWREAAHRSHARASVRPRRLWHFSARLGGRAIGSSVVFITTGRLGVAGLYDVDVSPDVRNRGIGKAVTRAACRFARDIGCRYALLNATPQGEPVYRRLGFASLGRGQTWWMHRPVIASPPTALQVALAEAVGTGDLPALDALRPRIVPEDWDAPLPCGMTPVQVAVATRRPASAAWLATHGATLDMVSAWDLGWKDRVRELLSRSPALANLCPGAGGATPLHEAAARGDAELARAVLAADPDLELRDAQADATALGWARHFGHAEIAALIEEHQGRAYTARQSS